LGLFKGGGMVNKCFRKDCKNVFTHDPATLQLYCGKICRLLHRRSKKGLRRSKMLAEKGRGK